MKEFFLYAYQATPRGVEEVVHVFDTREKLKKFLENQWRLHEQAHYQCIKGDYFLLCCFDDSAFIAIGFGKDCECIKGAAECAFFWLGQEVEE